MDAGNKDGIILKLQSELDKLKEVFRCSADSQNWVKSEKVCRCSDQEFDDLLKTLSANEIEAASLILQRHIDLEQQISKCLENLKAVQSGWDGKNIDTTQKIITSQSKIARLRSRLLRCITQQLHKNGSIASVLPPWSARDVNRSKTMEETNKVEPENEETTHLSTEEQIQVPADENSTDKGTREVEGSGPGDIPVYSTVEKVSNPSATSAKENLQVQPSQSVLSGNGSKDSASKENEEKEDNDVYETVYPPQPSRPAPPKPLPYSMTKKSSKPAGDGKLVKKVKK
ncbi:hypothetical protein ACROYT_G033651 [Oculina patagonica]